jgi:Zn-finger nucleic acid-binding protein
MKCPVCTGIDLKIAERQGIEIDYCPDCRGVWLDRGELDKIIERSAVQAPAYSQPPPQQPQQPQYQQPGYNQQQYGKPHHDDHGYGQNGYHKKKSWMSELFD